MKPQLVSRIVLAIGCAGLLPAAAGATLTFKQLGDDLFVVSHRVKIIGSRGQAMDLVYTKAASLCLAAGFSHFEILGQESEANQVDDSANASVRVRYFHEAGGERIDCSRNADPKYVEQAREKLAKQGIQAAAAPATGSVPAAAGEDGNGDGGKEACSIEQIASMARSGLSDEQIRAACG
jgi:hypothetical protein